MLVLLSQKQGIIVPRYLRGNLDKYVIFCPFTSNRIVSKEQEHMFTLLSL